MTKAELITQVLERARISKAGAVLKEAVKQ